jgi:hypothetical protein
MDEYNIAFRYRAKGMLTNIGKLHSMSRPYELKIECPHQSHEGIDDPSHQRL